MTKIKITKVPAHEWLTGTFCGRRAWRSPRKGRRISLLYHAARLVALQALGER